jgi:hypothetical protein
LKNRDPQCVLFDFGMLTFLIIYGRKGEWVTGSEENCSELHDLYYLANIRVINQRRLYGRDI